MEQVWWYATRAAGLMTWSAAVASVLVGLMLSTRLIRSRTGPWVLDLHRFLGGLTLAFLLIHLATLWADSYVEFGWQELLVPGESQWRPQAVAWGVVSAWILFAVEVTSILRKHIGQTLWRMVHWMSLLVVAGGTVHAMQAGSDVENPITWAVAGAGSVALIVLGAIRLRRSAHRESSRRPTTDTEILLEMRERLADLPVPETGTRLEYVAEATESPLPRREGGDHRDATLPGGGALLDALDRAARQARSEAPTFTAEPVASVPEADPMADVGGWPGPSPDDPFRVEPASEDPSRPEAVPSAAVSELPTRRAGESSFVPAAEPRPAPGPQPFFTAASSPSESPFAPDLAPDRTPDLTTSPFAPPTQIEQLAPRATPQPAPSPPAPRELEDIPAPSPPAPRESEDIPAPAPAPSATHETTAPMSAPPTFEPAVPEFHPASQPFETVESASGAAPYAPAPMPLPTADGPAPPADPFSKIEPPTISLTAPVPAPQASVALAPPPLPDDAIDPSTGEPDEAAYRQWLVDWLDFAEHYGDETPSDPTRF